MTTMTIQRLALGTVVGGLVLTLLGYLVYGMVFANFFAANAGSASGVTREPFNFVALVIGQLAWGALLTFVLGWRSVSSVGEGVKVGALAGLLFFLGIDLTLFATTNIQNLTASLVDAVLAAILFAVAGAAIVSVSRSKVAA
jgi:hypothetical protein